VLSRPFSLRAGTVEVGGTRHETLGGFAPPGRPISRAASPPPGDAVLFHAKLPTFARATAGD